MGDVPTQREWEQAKDNGGQARRAGKRIGDCPYRGYTRKVRLLSDAWHTGFRAADMAIRAGRGR